jgi:type II secretory pathway pseudopilin PulG
MIWYFFHKKCSGFSIAQLLVTLVLVGTVAAATITASAKINEAALERAAVAKGMRLRGALQSYHERTGGHSDAWLNSTSEQARYALLLEFMPFAPASLSAYTPTGYVISLPSGLESAVGVIAKPVISRTSDGKVLSFTTGTFLDPLQ